MPRPRSVKAKSSDAVKMVQPAFGQWEYRNYHLSCWSSPWTQYKTYYHTTQTWLCGEGGKACLVIASSVERDRHYSVSLTIALRHSTWVGTTSDMMQFWRASASYLRDTAPGRPPTISVVCLSHSHCHNWPVPRHSCVEQDIPRGLGDWTDDVFWNKLGQCTHPEE